MNSISVETMSNAELLTALCGAAGKSLAKTSLLELFGMVKPRQSEFFGAAEGRSTYQIHPQIAVAKELLLRAFQMQMNEGVCLSNPAVVRDFLMGRIGHLEHEVFWCIHLNIKNQVIAAEELFRGTISQTSVYPREVLKRCLELNSTSVIFAHNHPSGEVSESKADVMLTEHLKKALALVDVKVLDHLIVSGSRSMSFAEKGLI